MSNLMDKIGKVINVAATAVLMNVVFLISCLPIVTIGQAWCGLMGAIRYNIRGEKWFEGFKIGFKTRFWRGTVLWCIALPFLFVALMDLQTNALTVLGAGDQSKLVPMILSAIIFLMESALVMSLLVLNVYIPTEVGQWMRNGTDLIQKAPLQILASAILVWAPILLFLLAYQLFFRFALIWAVGYFAAAALGTTLLMKDALVDKLVESRENGTLTAEEGRAMEKEEAEEE